MKKYIGHCLTLIGYCLTVAVLASCEKEIDLDYHEAEKHYVVEAKLTTTGTEVRVSTTRAVTDNDRAASYVETATVTLTDDYGLSVDVPYEGKGLYTSDFTGMPGYRYTIDVAIDGQHYTSYSVMQDNPQVSNFRFVWKDVLSGKVLFADLRLQDRADQKNYYFMHLFKNRVGYRWAVMDDTRSPGGELQQLFSCTTKDEMDKGTSKDAIHEGDQILLEVRTIDKRSYDYFYSLQLMDDTGTNPNANFTGGCLGYFSAYGLYTHTYTFDLSLVEEE